MEIGVTIGRHVVVNDNVYVVDVYSTAENVCGYQYSLVKLLEGFIAGNSRGSYGDSTVLLVQDLGELIWRGNCNC